MLDTIVFYAVSSPNYCPNIKLQMTRIDLQIFDVVVVALVREPRYTRTGYRYIIPPFLMRLIA